MNRNLIDKTLWPAVILLVAVIAAFELLPLDIWLQDHFYDAHHGWWVNAKAPLPKLLFYTGPKFLLLLLGIWLFIACFSPKKIRMRIMPDEQKRRDWIVVLATLIIAPLLISTLKATTHVFCPYQLSRYDGTNEYVPTFERYTEANRPSRYGKGFPAGHASGGFALLSLAGVGRRRASVLAGAAVGISAGIIMGIYQMFKGAHFLSHTLVTGLICWLVFLVLRRLISLKPTPQRAGIS